MKKWLVFLYLFLIITSLILFTIDKNTKKEIKEPSITNEEKNKIENKANQTILVKLTKTGEVVAMDFNDYLKGVVPGEMPPYYNIEALKAQAIVARTYAYRKMQDKAEIDADICDNFNHCQVYYSEDKLVSIWKNKGYTDEEIKNFLNNINTAVSETTNTVVTYNGEYIKAFFHASSPVKTENVDQIWGGIKIPYLLSVDNVEDENYPNRYSTVEMSFKEFEKKIKDNIDKNYVLKDINSLKVKNMTTSNRVKNISIDNIVISAEKLRTVFGLKSTDFTIEIKDNIKFNVVGYGHGIGMSQVGANYLAGNGKNCNDIINHYYTNVKIEKIT